MNAFGAVTVVVVVVTRYLSLRGWKREGRKRDRGFERTRQIRDE